MKDKIISTFIILTIIIFFIIGLIFTYQDFSLFGPGRPVGFSATKRVNIITGIYISLISLVFILAFYFENKLSLFKFIMKLQNYKSQKDRYPILWIGILGIILSIWAFIGVFIE